MPEQASWKVFKGAANPLFYYKTDIMKVLKFGGTSVGSPDSIRIVKEITNAQDEPVILVVSAFGGITDQIIQTANMAMEHDPKYKDEMIKIGQRHFEAIQDLLEGENRDYTMKVADALINEFQDILHGVYLLEDLSNKTMDYLLSFGERLSAFIISRFIEDIDYLDSRKLILTDSNFSNATVDFQETGNKVRAKLSKMQGRAILPCFVASDFQGKTTTLGRGGSDYTAAIVAAMLKASVLEIWTDVDGFMTADPRIVKKAHPIDCMTYEEAMELSHFGAKVVYTPTLSPAFKASVPIRILNTFNREARGTLISHQGLCSSDHLIKGISSIDNVDLVTVKGAGMVGKTGTSARVFSALARNKVNVILITQASSEMTISFAVDPSATEDAVAGLEEEFLNEIEIRQEMEIEVLKDLSIIAIVGEEMRHTPGISAILYQSLGRNGISVIATAQGSSELNISVVIKRESLKKALNAINEGFFLSDFKEIHLFIAGTGNVGSKLLNQISMQQKNLMESQRLKINVVGITNSRKMLIDTDGIDISDPEKALESGEKANVDAFLETISELNMRNSVFVDCTASEVISDRYIDLFESYVSVITANKIACSSEYSLFKELKQSALNHGIKFSFETNVGAGLPVISTIEDLISSGDKILEIEAVVSGTLNYIFNILSEEIPFSKAITMAMENGYSEPDPRLDLSGMDVKRKLLILARELGYPLEEDQVKIEKFLPDDLFEGDVESFLEEVKKLDAEWEEKRLKLKASGRRWRYVAALKDGKGTIGLREMKEKHPAYQLEASNNIILLTTSRYNELPLLIQGYGAGADVTAAGLFADVIRAGNR